jgi:hypothetical protein
MANGAYDSRTQIPQGTLRWEVSASQGNLVPHVQRAGRADFELQQTRQEITRLAGGMREA